MYGTKKAAENEAEKMAKLLPGKGWKLRVWENGGEWHFDFKNGPLSVIKGRHSRRTYYWCLMTDDPNHARYGAGVWSTNTNAKNPTLSLKKQVKAARAYLNKITAAVEKAEAILKGWHEKDFSGQGYFSKKGEASSQPEDREQEAGN